jgi:hypothetical protein
MYQSVFLFFIRISDFHTGIVLYEGTFLSPAEHGQARHDALDATGLYVDVVLPYRKAGNEVHTETELVREYITI